MSCEAGFTVPFSLDDRLHRGMVNRIERPDPDDWWTPTRQGGHAWALTVLDVVLCLVGMVKMASIRDAISSMQAVCHQRRHLVWPSGFWLWERGVFYA